MSRKAKSVQAVDHSAVYSFPVVDKIVYSDTRAVGYKDGEAVIIFDGAITAEVLPELYDEKGKAVVPEKEES